VLGAHGGVDRGLDLRGSRHVEASEDMLVGVGHHRRADLAGADLAPVDHER
jgi:hypothetical protein